MFDGTDLSMAYGSPLGGAGGMGGMGGGAGIPMGGQPPMMEPVQQVSQPPPVSAPVPKATASHAMPPEVSYSPPVAMYNTAQQPLADVPTDSFWDRIASRKGEMIKLFVLALVVLLGISMDRVGSHYLNGYISRSFLGDFQEFLVRLAYPVVIILVLWIIRASV